MFETLEYLAPARTVAFTLQGVRTTKEPVVLQLVYGGNGSTFFNEFAKLKRPSVDASQSEWTAWRERVATLLASHVVVGWEYVDDKGAPVPFTPENCAALFRRLINLKDARGATVGRWDIVEGVLLYALDPDNFRAPMPEPDELGKG